MTGTLIATAATAVLASMVRRTLGASASLRDPDIGIGPSVKCRACHHFSPFTALYNAHSSVHAQHSSLPLAVLAYHPLAIVVRPDGIFRCAFGRRSHSDNCSLE